MIRDRRVGDVTMWDGRGLKSSAFLAHVPVHLGLDACWPWPRCQENGYGTYGRFKGAAHQVMFYLAHGRRPHGEIRHMCHNRACVNPLHLGEGTRSQNMRDAWLRGSAPNQKLTPEQREEIQRLYYDPKCRVTQKELARRFGVDQTTISRVVREVFE